jgi:hypothetical protein
MFASGTALESFLKEHSEIPHSVAWSTGRFLSGVSEPAVNEMTGKTVNYDYGLFPFLLGKNGSRFEAPGACYEGEPELVRFLTQRFQVPIPTPQKAVTWNCSQIAAVRYLQSTGRLSLLTLFHLM